MVVMTVDAREMSDWRLIYEGKKAYMGWDLLATGTH